MKKLKSLLLLSDSSAPREGYTEAAGFTAASFLYFFSLVLYTWSTPVWFSRFPRASAFRFILAVGVYCLCCMLFCGLRFAGIVCRLPAAPFVRTFLLSFIPVVVFSVLVLAGGGLSLQHLQLVVRMSDIYVCAGLWAGIYAAEKKLPPEQAAAGPFSTFFLYGMIQTAAALISLLPYIPGFITAVCRTSVLFVFLFYEIFRHPFYSERNRSTAGMKNDSGISTVAAQYGLSARETEVFELVCRGRTNEEIAAGLFISLSTVKTHLSSIFLKTGVRNRLEAAALCRKN
ncbi:MAG: helix-turn-helix transcriptional regulator [Treponema sp.]|nr:helix-turn-helix transcriptional regulator [Treponema sp.]